MVLRSVRVEEEKMVGSIFPVGLILSGSYIGRENRVFTDRETGQRRSSYRWGLSDGTAHGCAVYVPEVLYNTYMLKFGSDMVLKVRPFPSGKDVGYSLIGIVSGTVLMLESGGSVDENQISGLLKLASG